MIWRYQVCAASHTLELAVHEGLLSQCSVTDSPANTRKVVGQCCISICRIRESNMKVYTLFQQNKKPIKEQLGCRYFFLNAAVLSRKIVVEAEYWIRTQYRHLLNIKGLISSPLVCKSLKMQVKNHLFIGHYRLL